MLSLIERRRAWVVGGEGLERRTSSVHRRDLRRPRVVSLYQDVTPANPSKDVFLEPERYAAAGGPNQVVNASASPS